MSLFRPMLGAKIEDIDALRYPLVASFKLDGVRAIWWGQEFMSRTLKTIPNRALQRVASRLMANLPRWDGELICGEPYAKDVYNRTIRSVMTEAAPADDLTFFVFDNADSKLGFSDRLHSVHHIPGLVFKLMQLTIRDKKELLDFEASALEQGYEGLCLRAPNSGYKQGRSTFREHGLLKLKRFHDFEAEVVDFEELERNENPLERDERGYAKRSSHQENKIRANTLGALVCRLGDRVFRVGTGFSQADRDTIWRNKENYRGRLARLKSFPIGVKDLPRHPVFLGWRPTGT